MRAVFDSVAPSYDLMNDVMSLGVHRLWKGALIDWLAPQPGQKLVDLAGGTGDIALRFLRRGGGEVLVVDINEQMQAGRRGATCAAGDRISWQVGNAERLAVETASADRVPIAFGLRNVTDRQAALGESLAYLKAGRAVLLSEFSHVSNAMLARLYDRWVVRHPAPIGRGDCPGPRRLSISGQIDTPLSQSG